MALIKQIEGFPQYFVTDDGDVISLRCVNPVKMVGGITLGGYRQVLLAYNLRKYRPILAHRLVAKAFIPNPQNKPCVNHKNANKLDNNISNLEWCTYSENNRHSILYHGTKPPLAGIEGLRKNTAERRKFSEEVIRSICERYTHGESSRGLARCFNVTRGTISTILKGKSYRDVARPDGWNYRDAVEKTDRSGDRTNNSAVTDEDYLENNRETRRFRRIPKDYE